MTKMHLLTLLLEAKVAGLDISKMFPKASAIQMIVVLTNN